MWSVEKLAAEESSGHRFLAWVIRHPDEPSGRRLQRVEETGDYQRYPDGDFDVKIHANPALVRRGPVQEGAVSEGHLSAVRRVRVTASAHPLRCVVADFRV